MRKKRPILQMAEQYRLASENQVTAEDDKVEFGDGNQALRGKTIVADTIEEEKYQKPEVIREEIANDYVQNLYDAVAQYAPKQEGEGIKTMNYET